MSKPKVDMDSLREELKDSVFFRSPRTPMAVPEASVEPTQEQPQNPEVQVPRYHGTVVPTPQEAIVEAIRRAVRVPGKEAATHRLSFEEKKAIKQLVFRYDEQGIKTSEMQLTRIALNYLLEDYRANGGESILAQVLEKLNQ